ncbi:MAG TPA: hypothetical protein VK907_07535, partial [Phnomibacter sp.]|nr:hypothetical protein [Phnomibacter sp.]
MRNIVWFLIVILNTSLAVAQNPTIRWNIRSGNWSDTGIWDGNRSPGPDDVVFLTRSVVIDVDVQCQTLNTNGHEVTVSPGATLKITEPSPSHSNENDTYDLFNI